MWAIDKQMHSLERMQVRIKSIDLNWDSRWEPLGDLEWELSPNKQLRKPVVEIVEIVSKVAGSIINIEDPATKKR